MLENLTIFDKKKLLMEAEIGIVNLRDAASREPQLFIRMANGEVPNAATGQAYTEAELNAQIANWLGRLANMRNRLKYMRDTIMTDDPEFDSLAQNIFGVPKKTADALGQAVATAVDAFAHAMYYSPERINGRTDRTFAEIIAACNDLSAAVGSPVSLWEIDIKN
jgi:hypothetical protein